MLQIVVPGQPVTKKNSQQILVNKKTGRPFVSPSKQYKQYKSACAEYLSEIVDTPIDYPVQVTCVYYMPTRRRVDLTNLMEATHDILVDYGILEDDNCRIVQSVDGSRVDYDKDNPRVDITITKVKDGPESPSFDN